MFEPLQRATPARRRALLVVGPLIWLAAAITVGVVVDRTDVVELGLLLTGAAFVLAAAVFVPLRGLRVRRERRR